MLHDLRHPELTGMSRKHLSDLTHSLMTRLEERREQVRHAARGDDAASPRAPILPAYSVPGVVLSVEPDTPCRSAPTTDPKFFSRRVNDLGALPGCGLPALWPTTR